MKSTERPCKFGFDMKREMELTHPGEMLKIEIVEGRNLSRYSVYLVQIIFNF